MVRGFGFVEFETQEEMERAIEASDGKALHGNEVTASLIGILLPGLLLPGLLLP